jgi:hemerythrin-like metal-binding protein
MAYLEWKEGYLTNISKFDEHHQKLVALLNTVHADVFNCQSVSEKQPLIEKNLVELLDYAEYHFAAEEELMLKYEYPDYESHKAQHEQLQQQATRLLAQHKDGNLIWVFPIVNLLKNWIISHTLTTDRQYVPYFNERNIQ